MEADSTAPVATGLTVRLVPQGETTGYHRASKRSASIGAEDTPEVSSLVAGGRTGTDLRSRVEERGQAPRTEPVPVLPPFPPPGNNALGTEL